MQRPWLVPGRHLKILLASAAIKMRVFRIRPVAVVVTMNVSFVARGYVGNQEHLADLIAQAVLHRGTALVDILQPCVSFNKANSYQCDTRNAVMNSVRSMMLLTKA